MMNAIRSFLFLWLFLLGVMGGFGGSLLVAALGCYAIQYGFIWQGLLMIFLAPLPGIIGFKVADWCVYNA